MTTRTFNYTGRIHIKQECIDAALTGRSSGAPCLEVDFDWAHVPSISELPGDSTVFVDAFHGMSFMRFHHGTLNDLNPPTEPRLTDLDSWTSASFVVRIVDEDGRLLAKSRGHTNEKWWEAAMEEGRPLNTNSLAMAMVMPNVLEGMLKWLLLENEWDAYQLSDDPTWKGAWIRFARGLFPDRVPPPAHNDSGEYQSTLEVLEWIRLAVSHFCENHGITSTLVFEQGGR